MSSSEINPRTISSGNTTTTQKLGRRPHTQLQSFSCSRLISTLNLLHLAWNFTMKWTAANLVFQSYQQHCVNLFSKHRCKNRDRDTHHTLSSPKSGSGISFFSSSATATKYRKIRDPAPPTQQSSRQNTMKFLYKFTHTGRGKLNLPK